ncbi:hypothetical protein EON71_00065 [bacterium]|nr:MAG: hypothetical protein EON71_00065 [bacterium]
MKKNEKKKETNIHAPVLLHYMMDKWNEIIIPENSDRNNNVKHAVQRQHENILQPHNYYANIAPYIVVDVSETGPIDEKTLKLYNKYKINWKYNIKNTIQYIIDKKHILNESIPLSELKKVKFDSNLISSNMIDDKTLIETSISNDINKINIKESTSQDIYEAECASLNNLIEKIKKKLKNIKTEWQKNNINIKNSVQQKPQKDEYYKRNFFKDDVNEVHNLYKTILEKTPMINLNSLVKYLKIIKTEGFSSFRQKLAVFLCKNNTFFVDKMKHRGYLNDNFTIDDLIPKKFLEEYANIITIISDVFIYCAQGNEDLEEYGHTMYINYSDLSHMLFLLKRNNVENVVLKQYLNYLFKSNRKNDASMITENTEDIITGQSILFPNIKFHVSFYNIYECNMFGKILNDLDSFVKKKNTLHEQNICTTALGGLWLAPCDEILFLQIDHSHIHTFQWAGKYKSSYRINKIDKNTYKPPRCNNFSDQIVAFNYKEDSHFYHIISNNRKISSLPIECTEFLSEKHVGSSKLQKNTTIWDNISSKLQLKYGIEIVIQK